MCFLISYGEGIINILSEMGYYRSRVIKAREMMEMLKNCGSGILPDSIKP